jgi:divinyl chlorophyllide a 8-vinyl-reductase
MEMFHALVVMLLMFCVQDTVCGMVTVPLHHIRRVGEHGGAANVKMSEAAAEGPVVVLGATGYIGKAVVRELVERGRPTIAFIRSSSDRAALPRELEGADVVEGDPQMDVDGSLKRALTGASGVISCISSRSGSPREVEEIDYGASRLAMDLLIEHGHPRAAYVLLSAVCVKTPVLELHRAKLRIERELATSGLPHAIVRPTAYFKSISAQVANVVAGQPYVLFGEGQHTKCNAIGQRCAPLPKRVLMRDCCRSKPGLIAFAAVCAVTWPA